MELERADTIASPPSAAHSSVNGGVGAGDALVAAAFTIAPALDAASFLLREFGLEPDLRLAGEGPLIAKALDPASDLRAERGFRVIAFRWRDVAPAAGAVDPGEMLDALKAADDGARCLALICPDADPAFASSDADATAALTQAFAASSSLEVLDARCVFDAFGVAAPFDPVSDAAAQIPYTDEGMAAIGASIARWRSKHARPPTKLIAVDGDETLWGGVLGEVGVNGVTLTAGHATLQAELKAAVEEGVSLALVTKNEPADIEALFTARRDFPLTTDHFHTIAAGWAPKVNAITDIMSTLAVGEESVVFLDDNPVECAAVRAALPAAMVARAPEAERLANFVRHYWPLDRIGLTDADRLRRSSHAAEARRRDAEAAADSLAAFYESLGLRVDIRPACLDDAPRLAQMAARTNQFNSTLERRGLDAFRSDISRQDRFAYVISVSDRFGDYGVVGGVVGGICDDDEAVELDLWTLSCRALGRGVEHQIAARLGHDAIAMGRPLVRIKHATGPRNTPFRAFLAELAEETPQPAGATQVNARKMTQVRFDPSARAKNATAQRPKAIEKTLAPRFDVDAIGRLASEYVTASDIVRTMRGVARPRPDIAAAYLRPRPGLEATIADLWADILNIDEVGADDPFTALGATSFHFVRAHARLPQEVRSRVALADLFRFGTPRSLTDFAEGGAGNSIDDRRGEKMRRVRMSNAAFRRAKAHRVSDSREESRR
ncbi:MAG: HAD-IIIC family phosphatase [Pseudomonadota bacterium]